MTRLDPNAEGDTPRQQAIYLVITVVGFLFFIAVACLAADLADRIGASL